MTIQKLALKVGSAAIAKNDLVQIAEGGKLWPVKTKRFSAINAVDYESNVNNVSAQLSQANTVCECLYFNETTLDKIILSPISENLTNNQGLMLKVYNEQLTLTASAIVTPDLTVISSKPIMKPLSNGNLLLLWKETTTSYYAVYDQQLNVIVVKTTLGDVEIESVAIKSAGGFAILTRNGDDLSLALYSNTGTVVLAPAVINTSTDATAKGSAIAELSDGKLIIAIRSGTFNVQQAIFTSAGVAEGAFTNIVGITGGDKTRFSISVIAGFYCIVAEAVNQVTAAVFNNTGTLLNYNNGFFLYQSLSDNTTYDSFVVNDGSYFWVVRFTRAALATNSYIGLLRLAKDGNNGNNKTYKYAFNNITLDYDATLGKTNVQGFYKNNTLVFTYENSTMIISIENYLPKNISYVANGSFFASAIAAAHDGAIFRLGREYNVSPPPLNLTEGKYTNSAIMGIALESLNAGNEGALININVADGSFNCNTLLGVDCFFDHSSNQCQYPTLKQGLLLDNAVLISQTSLGTP